MTAYFYDLFDSIESIRAWFEEPDALPDTCSVIAAAYSYESYSGDATVIYAHGGDVYEVHGSHCSCYGLEDQWKPEQANISELRARMKRAVAQRRSEGSYGISSAFATHVLAALDALEAAP